MLYRHFPKIANKDFSILSLSLAGMADETEAKSLLDQAVSLGINLVDAGFDPVEVAATARRLSDQQAPAIPGASFSLLFEFRGHTAGELDALIAAASNAATDCFLLLYLADGASLDRIKKAGILAMADTAKKGNRISGYGFASPPVPAIIAGAAEAWGSWDFYRTDCNYLTAAAGPGGASGLNEALRVAALRELLCIASDAFAGGLLERQSPAVHEVFRNAPVPRSHDEWALRAVWEKQEVVTVVCKPANSADLLRKAIYAEAGRPNSLPGKELAVLEEAAKLSVYRPDNP